jgi:hypothetical protein
VGRPEDEDLDAERLEESLSLLAQRASLREALQDFWVAVSLLHIISSWL